MSTITSVSIGSSWPGAGDHEGHTVTMIKEWPVRIENCTVHYKEAETVDILRDIEKIVGGVITSGRVRCSCLVEWDTVGRPLSAMR